MVTAFAAGAVSGELLTAMEDEYGHETCVRAWMQRAAKGPSSERLLDAFEQAFAVVWHRAYQTLGDVTLVAIADRVLVTAADRFPLLSGLWITATGIECQPLREHLRNLQGDELAAGLRFVMVEFLTVLGRLTAQILTPDLHSELAKIATSETS